MGILSVHYSFNFRINNLKKNLKSYFSKLNFFLFSFFFYKLNYLTCFYNFQLKLSLISKKSLDFIIQIMKYSSWFRFNVLIDMVALDEILKKKTLAIFYILRSLYYNRDFILEINLKENDFIIKTITDFYNSANWVEREIFDMFGIFFEGHLDLRRILTDYGFSGYPLRKIFPVIGFKEIFFQDLTKTLSYNFMIPYLLLNYVTPFREQI